MYNNTQYIYLGWTVNNMQKVNTVKPFTTNMALRDSLDSNKKHTDINQEDLPKDILNKIKLIEKAFKKH